MTEFKQPKVQRPNVAALDDNDVAGPLDFAHQLAAALLPGASEPDRRAEAQHIIDFMRQEIDAGRLTLRRQGSHLFARNVSTESATWLLAYVLQKAEFIALARKAGVKIPAQLIDIGARNGRFSDDENREMAWRLAYAAGDRLSTKGIQNISARNVADVVTVQMQKDPRTTTQRGPVSDSTVRTKHLKGWTYKPAGSR